MRRHDPNKILQTAMKLVELEMAEMLAPERVPRVVMARVAVVGAVHELSLPQPGLMELTRMTASHRHHSSVAQRVQKFNRDWPPPLRAMWLEAVQCEANGMPAPMTAVPMMIAKLERALDDLRRTLCQSSL